MKPKEKKCCPDISVLFFFLFNFFNIVFVLFVLFEQLCLHCNVFLFVCFFVMYWLCNWDLHEDVVE